MTFPGADLASSRVLSAATEGESAALAERGCCCRRCREGQRHSLLPARRNGHLAAHHLDFRSKRRLQNDNKYGGTSEIMKTIIARA